MLAICLAIASIAAATFFYAVWQWRGDWVLAHQSTVSASVMAKTDTTDMIASLPEEHLFGQSLSKTSEMPISNLQLRVTGIVKVETEKYGTFSKVFISISGQPSKTYRIGDTLPYGVKVYDITADSVILQNNGHLEKLPLPREPLKFKPKNIEESK